MKRLRKAWWIRFGIIGVLLLGIAWGTYAVYPIYNCYLIPGEVTNRIYSTNLFHLERYQKSDFVELSADKIAEWRRSIKSLPLVADAVYVHGDAKHGTWHVTFESYENCLDSGDILELTYGLVSDGTVRVDCRARFMNARMIPFQCRE